MKKKVLVFASPLHAKWVSPKIEDVFTIPYTGSLIPFLMPRQFINWGKMEPSPEDIISEGDRSSLTFEPLQNGQSMFEGYSVVVYAFLIDAELLETNPSPHWNDFLYTEKELHLIQAYKAPLKSIFGTEWNHREYNKLGIFELPVDEIEILGCMWHECIKTNHFFDRLFLNVDSQHHQFTDVIKETWLRHRDIKGFEGIPRENGVFEFKYSNKLEPVKNNLRFFMNEQKQTDTHFDFKTPQI